MNFLKKLFGVRKRQDVAEGPDELLSIDEFIKLSADKRMMKVMEYGNTGDLKYYPLLKHCILNDPNLNVKFSALKRIHLFIGDPDCLGMLADLENRFNIRNLEPYYSMALSKTGIISLEDFKRRVNQF